MPVLDVVDLHVRFPTEDGVVHAVRGASLSVDEGEVLAVVGESGCGKSVTAMAVMGLLPRTAAISGSVRVDGVDVLTLPARQRSRYRGGTVGMVFQDPMSSLNPVQRISTQLAEAVRLHERVSRQAAKARAIALLAQVGIPQPAQRVDAYPHQFSGGMRQRVMIAMAIANRPRLLIADEPTTALDVTVQAEILDLLGALRAETDVAVILITHDLGVVAGMADRVAVMYAGTVVETAPATSIFAGPRMPYTVGLLGAIPRIDRVARRLAQIPGTTPSLIHLPDGCSYAPRCPLVIDACVQLTPVLWPPGADHRAACHRWRDVATGQTPGLFVDEDGPA